MAPTQTKTKKTKSQNSTKDKKKQQPLINEFFDAEDILISYKTGKMALVKDGVIEREFSKDQYQQMLFILNDWNKPEKDEKEAQLLEKTGKKLFDEKKEAKNG